VGGLHGLAANLINGDGENLGSQFDLEVAAMPLPSLSKVADLQAIRNEHLIRHYGVV
jgi:hypothetical protein